jgi:hypothetical protein
MKKITLMLILIVLAYNLFSQGLKTHTGTRSISIGDMIVDGIETFTYIEKNGERIKTGLYNFAKDIKKRNYNSYRGTYEDVLIQISISGYYANDKPDKEWTSKFLGSMNSVDAEVITTCTFEKGQLNGKFNSKSELQEANTSRKMFLTECYFKNNKIVGRYSLRMGTKGTTSPDYTRIAEFDKNGFLNNEYYKNGFNIDKKGYEAYDTVTNTILSDNILFIAKNKGYIDLNNGTINDIWGIEADCFGTFMPPLNDFLLIFEVTGEFPLNYVTREWVAPSEIEVEELINEYDENGFTNKARKLEYYLNLYQGFKLASEEQYKKAKNRYLKSLDYKDDPEVRNKIDELQLFIEFDSLYFSAYVEFKKYNFDNAKLLYLKAQTIKPDSRVDDMLLKISDIDKKYTEYINVAESEYKKGNPELSKVNFKLALSVKPNEQYPKEFIQRIDDEKYTKLVKTGETEYGNEHFEISRTNFQEALTVKPNEKYPKDFIQRIDKENIQTLAHADSLFQAKDFDNALTSYTQSIKYSSDNKRSKARKAEIEKTQNEISQINIKTGSKKTELEPELGRLYKRVYQSISTYYENKINAEKDIFVTLALKKEYYDNLNKIEALEQFKVDVVQKNLKDAETAEEYLKILNDYK